MEASIQFEFRWKKHLCNGPLVMWKLIPDIDYIYIHVCFYIPVALFNNYAPAPHLLYSMPGALLTRVNNWDFSMDK